MYPNTLGVTGEVFKTGQLVYANDMKKLPSFQPSIDNLSTNVKDVRSFECPYYLVILTKSQQASNVPTK